jgi:hypothetical protein
MAPNLRFLTALAALICVVLGTMTIGASAVTVELARKCAALTAKAYPPRVIGNPAAGSTNGTGLSEQSYYQKCVANGGNMDEPAPAPKDKN